MKAILTQIAERQTLSRADSERAMNLLLTGSASNEQISAFLMGLRARGESLDELIGFTHVMRSHAVSVSLPGEKGLDIVGMGGDRSGTFNISTAAAFVCAGAGSTVAKHGNRSVSSRCGSAQVLNELGVQTSLEKEGVEYCLNEVGLAFMFAPLFHPAMKHVMPVRRELGVRTCFNILGPLCNPAGVKHQLVGAFSLQIAEIMADILVALGSERFITVHGDDGLDEISICGPSTVFTFTGENSGIERSSIRPSDFGLPTAPINDIIGGDATRNAEMIRHLLDGHSGAPRDIVILNAAFALYAGDIVSSVQDGVQMATDSIGTGHARRSLERLVDASQSAPRT